MFDLNRLITLPMTKDNGQLFISIYECFNNPYQLIQAICINIINIPQFKAHISFNKNINIENNYAKMYFGKK